MPAFRNIILDLGGVIIDLDYQKTRNSFNAKGVSDFDLFYTQAKQSDLFDRYETGKMNDRDFIGALKKLLDVDIKDEEVIECWNAMLMDIPLQRLAFIKELKREYKVFLLSNTNPLHIAAFSKYIDSIYGYSRFLDLFTNVYYSSDIGLRKPDKEIFEYVLHKNHLNAHETCFVDDSEQHVFGARSCGIFSMLHQTNNEVQHTLALNGIG